MILISTDDSDGNKRIKVRQLTTDHKPELPVEKQRVVASGGKVAQA